LNQKKPELQGLARDSGEKSISAVVDSVLLSIPEHTCGGSTLLTQLHHTWKILSTLCLKIERTLRIESSLNMHESD
jgi:hypothetical protein